MTPRAHIAGLGLDEPIAETSALRVDEALRAFDLLRGGVTVTSREHAAQLGPNGGRIINSYRSDKQARQRCREDLLEVFSKADPQDFVMVLNEAPYTLRIPRKEEVTGIRAVAVRLTFDHQARELCRINPGAAALDFMVRVAQPLLARAIRAGTRPFYISDPAHYSVILLWTFEEPIPVETERDRNAFRDETLRLVRTVRAAGVQGANIAGCPLTQTVPVPGVVRLRNGVEHIGVLSYDPRDDNPGLPESNGRTFADIVRLVDRIERTPPVSPAEVLSDLADVGLYQKVNDRIVDCGGRPLHEARPC
ncbi:hypothetical protein [Methylobacterium nodulans]|uniref:Uncharacterized protein n=1 Tax=Methylobacterium nodulans (strain LMG 21967 / CNCM I-2342 / ORS 2060) TaxID=460265 RepID=B8IY69_METNO|nr:hypothetical protein [Methylobacterium nodulans]ACL63359.1 hypothetical protein Mnod_7768 [Methylobacterium nodulans ORS 2060]